MQQSFSSNIGCSQSTINSAKSSWKIWECFITNQILIQDMNWVSHFVGIENFRESNLEGYSETENSTAQIFKIWVVPH